MRHRLALSVATAHGAGRFRRTSALPPPGEQEALAVRIDAVVDGVRWEQCFYLPDRYLADFVSEESTAGVVLSWAERGGL